jgi:HEPN domain-containing protein
MCHQAIEKIFKGFYSALLDKIPPYRHELDLLARRGGFYEMLNKEQIAFIDVLNPLNIEARYPDYTLIVEKWEGDYFKVMPLIWRIRREVDWQIEPHVIIPEEDYSGLYDEIQRTGIRIN